MTYTCEGCGKTFEGTPEEAFEKGWDTPERFMSHTTCESCPISETLWWKVAILKETPTTEEVMLLKSYNEIYDNHQKESE